jgi:D-alanyl-D-alanine carboxypeptidase
VVIRSARTRALTVRRISRLIAVALVAATLCSSAVAAPPALKPLAQRLVATGAPGAVVYSRTPAGDRAVAAGRADLKKKTPMTPSMSFRVGSITKSFVAVVALQLVAEGKLTLADTAERWLPGALRNGTAVTLRQLLSHTSGVPNYTDNDALARAANANPKRVWTPLELLTYAAGPPGFAPGSSWGYSNTNYILAALIIEAATGHTIAAELQARILTPLALTRTTFPARPAMLSPFARGYVSSGTGARVDVTGWQPSLAWAAGALVSTAGDLARFYSALLGGRLLPQGQQTEFMRTSRYPDAFEIPDTFEYGLGIFKQHVRCRDGWGHAGGVPGYTSVAFASADGSRVAVVLVNESVTRRRETVAFDSALEGAFCAG